jgi:hypothetical protein
MRTRQVSLILLGCACVVVAHAKTDALQSKIDAYLDKVGPILAQALMPELAKHPELGDVRKRFSFRIDAVGHPRQINATSTPRSELLDRLVVRVIRGLKFPPIPKEILAKYKELEFRTEMGPPDQ